MGYSPQDRKESDTTEVTQHTHMRVKRSDDKLFKKKKKLLKIWVLLQFQTSPHRSGVL